LGWQREKREPSLDRTAFDASVPRTIYSREQQKLIALLRQLRIDAEVRQVDLAKRLRRPQSFVSKYEIGERRLDLIELREVCAALGVPLAEFVRQFEESLPRMKRRR
jgi:transcriptional regulator with XRE-family HTH domain